MRDYYSTNIKFLDPALAERLDSLEIQDLVSKETKRGVPSVIVKDGKRGEIILASLDDPYLEAREFISSYNLEPDTLAIVLGFGLGYHVFELYSQLSANGKIVVIEENLSIFKLALTLQNLIAILTAPNIELIIGQGREEIITHLQGIIGLGEINRVKILTHPPSLQLNPEYYGYLKKVIEASIEARSANLTTQALYGELWQSNILLNLPQIISHPPVDALYGKFTGRPAIIISAGPSLDKNIEYLRMVKGKALLICVDTALRPMLLREIKPDLVVCVDAQEVNYTHMEGLKTEGIYLVADGVVYPSILTEFQGERLIAGHGHPLMDWIYSYLEFGGLKIEPLRTGGSVATAAFDLARRIGADPIILVGQDLSFPLTGQLYTRGVIFLEEIYDGLNKFNTIWTVLWRLRIESGWILTEDILGRPVFTNKKLMNYLRWFEEEVCHTPAKCINATEGGILKQGFIQMSLKDAIREYCQRELDIKGFLVQAQSFYPRVDRMALRKGMEDLLNELISLQGLCEEAMAIISSGKNGLEEVNRSIDALRITPLIKDTLEGILYQSSKNIGFFYERVRKMSVDMGILIKKVEEEL